jgi:predicted DNA-binding transcriptional regulator AlpA
MSGTTQRQPLRITSDLDDAQLLTKAQLCAVLSISPASLDRRRDEDPGFPKPLRVTPGTGDRASGLRWSMGQVRRWVKRQVEANE